jgi:hypothetical protein
MLIVERHAKNRATDLIRTHVDVIRRRQPNISSPLPEEPTHPFIKHQPNPPQLHRKRDPALIQSLSRTFRRHRKSNYKSIESAPDLPNIQKKPQQQKPLTLDILNQRHLRPVRKLADVPVLVTYDVLACAMDS